MKKTLIQNALIYDGTGNRPFPADVLIGGSTIEKIGHLTAQDGYEIVQANGLALSPGFINTHSHMDLEIMRDPTLHQVIDQGITTEVLGQDGSSVAPLTDELVEELADNMAPLAGTIPGPYTWRSYAEYMQTVEAMKPAARYVGLVGHGTIRMNVMGNDNREPTAAELQAMQELLARCMDEGAKGMSMGLIYPPGSFAKTDELVELAKVVAAYDGLIMVHMRSEKDKLLESIDEMNTVVEKSGVRLQISHHKALGQRNWGKVHQSLKSINAMRDKGFDVTIDQYPWTAACTGLKVCVPQWAYDGGEHGFQSRLRDPAEYKKILKETRDEIDARGGAGCIMLASVATEEYAWMAGQKMDAICEKLQMEVGEATLHILQHEGPEVIAIYFSISEEDVTYVMQSDLHCVCTDGIVGAHPHPRAYASFPRFLGTYVRDKKVMPLEEAIRHITSEPARRLRLWDRGLIREGMSADMVLFDPETINNANTYLEPTIPSVGIHGVWVLGQRKVYSEK
ncbi:MAG: D-aminoacylase [Clostridiales bacterium]|nr:D-aminoacylase [Clostridiales bacterium]